MFKLYRSYRDKKNNPYETSIMPPIGFKVVETIKPRLTAAEMKVRLFPANKDAVDKQDILNNYESLVAYDMQEMDIEDKKDD